MQFKIHRSFEVFIAKSRCFPGTGGNTASCNCQTLLWHRLAEKQLWAFQFSRKDFTQLTMLKMQYRHDHFLQLIGMFIMGDKRQWVKVRSTTSECVYWQRSHWQLIFEQLLSCYCSSKNSSQMSWSLPVILKRFSFGVLLMPQNIKKCWKAMDKRLDHLHM